MAAVPPTRQPPPPNRIVRTWMPGMGGGHGAAANPSGGMPFQNQPWSSLATAPYEGSPDTTPARIVPLGTSSQQRTVNIPNLKAGQQYVARATIPLPLVPGNTNNQVGPTGPGSTPKGPVISRLQDQLLLRASMTVGNLLPGLHVLRFTAVPQGRSGPQLYNADPTTGALPVGQQYTGFLVNCVVTFQAEQTVTAGTVMLGTEGTLTRQAGGGA